MSKTLVIVESPAKCKTIEKYLGAGYRCMASCGHIRELDTEKGLACIDIAHGFTPSYKVASRKGDVVKQLREAARMASEVILATDDDREGEAIAWHLTQVLGLPLATTPRIVFHEITKSAIERAIENPRRVDMNRVLSQQARQVLDLLVGYSVSPVLWKYIAHKDKPLSAGRCQSPALRLVYEKEEEIRTNPSNGVYSITGTFTIGAALNVPCGFTLNQKLQSAKEVETFLEETVNHAHLFQRSAPSVKKCAPPEPLITTTLQRRAHSALGLSSRETMDAAQILYESGYITYMRTDSKALSSAFLKQADEWIRANLGDEYVGDRVKVGLREGDKEDASAAVAAVATATTSGTKTLTKPKAGAGKNPKGAQEAHEAIRPTRADQRILDPHAKISKREVRLYNLIWTITLESCCSPATYNSVLSQITAPSISTEDPAGTAAADAAAASSSAPAYTREDRDPIFLGWMAVKRADDVSKEGDEAGTRAGTETETGRTDGAPKRGKGRKKTEVIVDSTPASLDTTDPDISVSSTAISTPFYSVIIATPQSSSVVYTQVKSQYGLANQTHRLCESSLINQLERHGIGRPSTYASIVDTLFKREYVKRGNVEGTTIEAIEHILIDDTITETAVKRKAGSETGRILVEPTGVLVIKLLIERFDALFSYDYTGHMESQLDKIARGEMNWQELCEETYAQIQRLIGGLKDMGAIKENKQEIRLDDTHTYTIGRYGPVIRKLPPGAPKTQKAEFLRVKTGIDPRDIASGKLGLDDIIDTAGRAIGTSLSSGGISLGDYDGSPVILKDGKFGHYIQWNGKNMSVKQLMKTKKVTAETITLEHIEPFLREYNRHMEHQGSSGAGASASASTSTASTSTASTASSSTSTSRINPNVVRYINSTMSIRTGKFGHYIFHQNPGDDRPTFFPLKGFKGDYVDGPIDELLDWIRDTYNVEA